MSRYGNTGLHFDVHSCDSLTGFNMMNSFKQEVVNDVAGNTTVSLYGPAANVLAASGLLKYVSGGKQTTIGVDGHRYDLVSRNYWRKWLYLRDNTCWQQRLERMVESDHKSRKSPYLSWTCE
ncbi:hypothetical protein [Bartonella tribocorum]|nr:hypothetical protein [Bartonella tribocorum]CDO49841.1 hypothetical protein BM1374166_02198 [Bartonella tribocorum]